MTEMNSGVKNYTRKSISGRSKEFDFSHCFAAYPYLAKISNFDEFKLSQLMTLSVL